MIDKHNAWLFYAEFGKRRFRGRWGFMLAAVLYCASLALTAYALRQA